MPNHVVTADVPDAVRGRAVLVERLDMLPVECVARAYLTGGGLGEYTATGAVSGIPLPAGLVDGDRLPEPIFTPVDQGADGRARRADPLLGRRGPARGARSRGGCVTSPSRSCSAATRSRRRAASCSPTPRSSSACAVTRCAGRRGAHPRLVAVLAGRPVGARARPAQLRQAVRARLADLARLGLVEVVGGGPAAAARRRGRRRPARSTSRPTSGSPARPSDPSSGELPPAPRVVSARTVSVQLAMARSAAARSPVTATSKSSPRAIASDCRARVLARSGGSPRSR